MSLVSIQSACVAGRLSIVSSGLAFVAMLERSLV